MDFQYLSPIIDKLAQKLKQERIVKKNDKVLIALSGGPDSVMLFYLALLLRDRLKLVVYAGHLNHMTRGRESAGDERFVRCLTRKHHVRLFCGKADIKNLKIKNRSNFEEEAREARYSFFRTILQRHRIDVLMTGHTLDDQVETFLMRLIRGSGLKGLAAIKRVRAFEGAVLARPLLETSKEDVLKYLAEHKIMYRKDRTNLSPMFTRNKIRLELVPLIKDKFNAKILEVISQTADQIGQGYQYIYRDATDAYALLAKEKKGEITMSRERLKKYPTVIKYEVLRIAIEKIKGDLNKINFSHIQTTDKMISGAVALRSIDMPGHVRARLRGKDIIIENSTVSMKTEKKEKRLKITGSTEYGDGKFMTNIGIPQKMPSGNRLCESFDYDCLGNNLKIRMIKKGDRMTVLGMNRSKLISKILKDEKIDKKERSAYPVIVDGKNIVWLCGVRMSDKYKINKNTKKTLAITYMRYEKN